MNIANIGAFAGGLQRGAVLAGEERRLEEDQQFQRERQQAWKDEQARQERIRQGIAGVARPGAEVGRQPFVAEGIDGPENIPGLYNVKQQTEQDYLRQLADVYSGAGEVEGMLRLRNAGFEQGQRERALRQQGAADAALGRRADMVALLNRSPEEFVAKYSPLFNSDQIGGAQHKGAKVAFASTPQGQIGYLVTPDGKVGGQFPVTREALMGIIDQMTDADLGASSPEMYAAAAGRGIQRGQLGAQQTTAAAAMRNAATQEAYRADLAKLTPFQQKLLEAQAGTYRAHSNLYGVQADNVGKSNRLGQVVGQSEDGSQVLMNTPSGLVASEVPPGFGHLFPKVTGARPAAAAKMDEAEKLWQTHLGKLQEANPDMTPAQVAQAKTTYMSGLGVAPQQFTNDIRRGERVGPDGKVQQLTVTDVENFNARFPRSAVDPNELSWIRRQLPLGQHNTGAATGGTATKEPAPAKESGDKTQPVMSDEQLAADVRQNGMFGLAERVLGPKPPSKSPRLQEWQARERDLKEQLSRIQTGLRRPQ